MDKIASFHYHPNLKLLKGPTLKPTKFSPSVALTSSQLSTSSLPGSPSALSSQGFNFEDELNAAKSPDAVKIVHARLLKVKICSDRDWNFDPKWRSLISSYLKVCDFRSAAMVFLVGFEPSYVFWNSFLLEFVGCGGDKREVLEVFTELNGKGVVFGNRVLAFVLRICVDVMDQWLGLEIHADLIKKGVDSDVYLKCALMNLYGRTSWGVESFDKMLDEMSERDDLLWNEAIMVNLRNERWEKALELFREMMFSVARPNGSMIAKVLQVCGRVGALDEGKQIHGYVLRLGFQSNLSVCNSLINMYSRTEMLELSRRVFYLMEDHNLSSWNSMISSHAAHGYLDDAWDIFGKMESSDVDPDIITWNCLMSGHALHGSYHDVLRILRRMQSLGFRPNSGSINSVLQAVTEMRHLDFGREVHGYAVRNGLENDVYVGTSLIDMYVKNECLACGQRVFDTMKNQNIVAWNSLITGYAYKGELDKAGELLCRMEDEGLKPDLVTWNGMIYGYAFRGHNEEALALLNEMEDFGVTPNVVSWTALISGCSQNGKYRESLDLFLQMQEKGVEPNCATIASVLRSCGGLSMVQKGKELHSFCIRKGLSEDAYAATALIDMYSKSGSLKTAHAIFRKMRTKTSASWNCMIMGFAIYGLGKEAISLFVEMRRADILPDAITFTALLSACKNSGLVNEGWKCFDAMSSDYNLQPTMEHYCCMVDLLGRAGYLDEAWDFIRMMPLSPDASIWGALLGACQTYKNVRYAEIAAEKLYELEPYNSANYALMMSIYAMSNRWDDVDALRDLMKDKGVRNGRVWSWIQIDNVVHLFSAEENHPDEGEIYFALYQLVSDMRKAGYVPDVSCVAHNIDDREKEKVVLSHTEKLAITYGLIKSKNNAPIRVIKNTRICPDCHTAAKYASLVRSREIIIRDGSRIHHFCEGRCSCNDSF